MEAVSKLADVERALETTEEELSQLRKDHEAARADVLHLRDTLTDVSQRRAQLETDLAVPPRPLPSQRPHPVLSSRAGGEGELWRAVRGEGQGGRPRRRRRPPPAPSRPRPRPRRRPPHRRKRLPAGAR